MRVVVIVLAVLILVALLWFFGVGRSGTRACVQDCEKHFCLRLAADQADCSAHQQDYDRCVLACRPGDADKR